MDNELCIWYLCTYGKPAIDCNLIDNYFGWTARVQVSQHPEQVLLNGVPDIMKQNMFNYSSNKTLDEWLSFVNSGETSHLICSIVHRNSFKCYLM